MPIRVKCEQCKKTLSVKDALAGKKIKCPVCQTVVVVPDAAPAGGAADSSSPSNPAAPAAGAPAVAKKPAVMGKPVARPAADRAKTNGAADPAKNGTSTLPPAPPPETVDRPHEHAEAEALAAFQEDDKPKEDEGPPPTIDFTCEHCDQELHLPLEEGGKRMQCPNPECRQLIKVPMPKIVAKKDWRKMDRVGPAAALINQPEQPDDAWSSQNATKARQDSLLKAGAIELPPKPKRDATAWLFLSLKSIAIIGIAVSLVAFVRGRIATTVQHGDIEELKQFTDLNSPKKIANELLRAEANRVLALLYLREPKGEFKSRDYINGAEVVIDEDEKVPAVNQQLFLISKAFTLIEQGGEGEEQEFLHIRREWDKVSEDLVNALVKIRDPELQAMAVREVTNRLVQKKQENLAKQLAPQIAAAAKDPAAPVLGQKIAVSVWKNEEGAIEELELPNPPLQMDRIEDPNIRSGFAEGYARNGEFDKAAKVALAGGEAKDRIEACLGVASIALAAKKPDEASKCVKEALKIADGADKLTDWNLLELMKLAARTEDIDAAKSIGEKLRGPEFKSRALLELFLAKCEKATGKIDPAELAELEASATKDDYVPLALAWEALAAHNTKFGASRGDNRKTFDARIKFSVVPAEVVEHLRPMVDVGTYLGSVK